MRTPCPTCFWLTSSASGNGEPGSSRSRGERGAGMYRCGLATSDLRLQATGCACPNRAPHDPLNLGAKIWQGTRRPLPSRLAYRANRAANQNGMSSSIRGSYDQGNAYRCGGSFGSAPLFTSSGSQHFTLSSTPVHCTLIAGAKGLQHPYTSKPIELSNSTNLFALKIN